MLINRPDSIYRNGILVEKQRERTSNVPTRYRTYWIANRVSIILPSDVFNFENHVSMVDDNGKRVLYVKTEQLGYDLTKKQALALLGE